MADSDDWNPVTQSYPSQPNWDNRSVLESPAGPPSPGQWSQDTLTPSGGQNGAQLLYDSAHGDYFSHSPGSVPGTPTTATPNSATPTGGYDNFIDRANRTIARDQRHVPDPFLEGGLSAPNRPFGAHSRVSSVESISSIVDEKSNSPLNKAIASVSIPYRLQARLTNFGVVHRLRRRRRFRFRAKAADVGREEL